LYRTGISITGIYSTETIGPSRDVISVFFRGANPPPPLLPKKTKPHFIGQPTINTYKYQLEKARNKIPAKKLVSPAIGYRLIPPCTEYELNN